MNHRMVLVHERVFKTIKPPMHAMAGSVRRTFYITPMARSMATKAVCTGRMVTRTRSRSGDAVIPTRSSARATILHTCRTQPVHDAARRAVIRRDLSRPSQISTSTSPQPFAHFPSRQTTSVQRSRTAFAPCASCARPLRARTTARSGRRYRI